jgi:hypothetical protein
MGVQALADMSDVERKLALERYKLLEPHLQNGRELPIRVEGLRRFVPNAAALGGGLQA